MVMRNVKVLSLGRFVSCAALSLLAVGSTSGPVQARWHHYHRRAHVVARYHHAAPATHAARINIGSYVGTNYAAMVVDANTGRTLYAVNEDAPRHPASLTKVMTLYLLFEELEKGRLRLDSPLTVSAHAAAQAPTKLGLRPGSVITVENAIKAIVTKSANDMAVTVAENIAGSEPSFAEAMTAKARQLGMTHTFYHNASGLPDMRQITTARDLTILGRAIRERFPRYYHYFSTPSFTYAGMTMVNHNHLLGRVDGMDGIKTGYTGASGFNLLTSVNRDGRRVVSVVLGGRTAAGRDRVMVSLLETHFEEASATPSTRVAEESPVEAPAATPRVEADVPVDRQPPRRPPPTVVADEGDAPAVAPTRVSFASSEDSPRKPVERQPPRGPSLIAPELALPAPMFTERRSEPPRPLPTPRVARLADAPVPPAPIGRPAPTPARAAPSRADERIRPAFIAGAPRAIDPSRLPGPLAADRRRLVLDGSTNRHSAFNATSQGAVATATPSALHWVTGAQPVRLGPSAPGGRMLPGRERADPGPTGSIGGAAKPETKPEAPAAANPKGGWVIQIGATDDAAKAADLLSRAQAEGRGALASAHPFTEKVQKGDATLYRARFAGLDPAGAEIACRTLKRSGFACFTTRN